MPTVGILGAGRLGRALAARISVRLPTVVSDIDEAPARSFAAGAAISFGDPPALGRRCDVVLVCVPPEQVAGAIASCAAAGPLYASLATSLRTRDLLADPRLCGLAVAGLKPVCQYTAIAHGLPTVFVTASAGHVPLLQEVVGGIGSVIAVPPPTEDAVGRINRAATLAALRACASLQEELAEFAAYPDLAMAAIRNVLAGTALDYPPGPGNSYTAALLETLRAERAGRKASPVNAGPGRPSAVDINGDPRPDL